MHACPCHRCLLLLGDNVGSLKSELFSHHNTHVHRVLRNVGTTYFWVPLLLSGSALLFHGMSWTCTSLVTTAYIARGHWLGLDVPGLAADKGVARGGGLSPKSAPMPAQVGLAPLQPSLQAWRAMVGGVGRETQHVVECEGH